MKIRYYLLVLFLFLCSPAFSQPHGDTGKVIALPVIQEEPNATPKMKIVNDRFGFLTDLEFTLSISVLLFGVLVLFLETYLIKIKKVDHEHITKIMLVTLIVIGTLFLITAGYNNNQIAPATGLLGTIAGYLLGKSSGTEKNTGEKNDKKSSNEE